MLVKKIFAPLRVGTPPMDADRSMMVLPDGEIRIYGNSCHPQTRSAEEVFPVVMKSRDNGLNWQTEAVDGLTPGATVRSPWSGSWISLLGYAGKGQRKYCVEPAERILDLQEKPGVYFFRADSPDGEFQVSRIFDYLHIQRLPLALQKYKRWLVPYQYRMENHHYIWGVLLSDDDGATWRKVEAPVPPIPGVQPGHGGLRWLHCGYEPVVAEYADGRLHALLRCSHDEHYESFSEDGGETWSEPVPSRFYAVATMPGLYRLSGGRMLAVWNNTVPLAEADHRTQYGGDDPDIINGVWEDVFTNRDALHAAISSDGGKTWHGFREILLNPARNDADFRSVFFPYFDGLDKSVHQNQILELPDGNVLVVAGQNPVCRSIVIFNPDWLLEETREEDFRHGLRQVSYHQFVKSPVGGCRENGVGHCSYNRRPGAALMPHPDRFDREVLLVAHHPDDRLVSSLEGVVWNFPASAAGRVTIRFRENSGSAGCRFILTDRWINPSDPIAENYALFSATLDGEGKIGSATLKKDAWHELVLEWDCGTGICRVICDGDLVAEQPRQRQTPNDVSYLHIQTIAGGADPAGVMFESFCKTGAVQA